MSNIDTIMAIFAPAVSARDVLLDFESRLVVLEALQSVPIPPPEEVMNNPNVQLAYLNDTPGDAGIKIQAAIDALPSTGGYVDATGFTNPQNLSPFVVTPGVIVHLGPIFHTIPCSSPIIVQNGGHLIGSGRGNPGGTTIKLFDNCNHDAIQCISTEGDTDFTWWHHGTVANLRILGNKENNASGNGLSVFGIAETSAIYGVSIDGCKDTGLYFRGSQSGTGTVRNITVNGCDGYGIQLDDFRSGISLLGVGGDHNRITLGITNPKTGGGSIYITDFKSEGAGKDFPGEDLPDIRILGGSSSVVLTLAGGNSLHNIPKTFIEMHGTISHYINIEGMVIGNAYTHLIKDYVNLVGLPYAAVGKVPMLRYYNNQWMQFRDAGLESGVGGDVLLPIDPPVDPPPPPPPPPPSTGGDIVVDFSTGDLSQFHNTVGTLNVVNEQLHITMSGSTQRYGIITSPWTTPSLTVGMLLDINTLASSAASVYPRFFTIHNAAAETVLEMVVRVIEGQTSPRYSWRLFHDDTGFSNTGDITQPPVPHIYTVTINKASASGVADGSLSVTDEVGTVIGTAAGVKAFDRLAGPLTFAFGHRFGGASTLTGTMIMDTITLTGL